MGKLWQSGVLFSILIALISACSAPQTMPVATQSLVTQSIVQTVPIETPVTSVRPAPTPTTIPVPTAVPIVYPKPDPAGCLRPVDDYEIVTVNGHFLNERTVSMLSYAQLLYGGEIQLDGSAVTQGSFTDEPTLAEIECRRLNAFY